MVIGGPAGRPTRGGSAHEPPTDEMTVKLTDFGIARAAEQTRLTQVGLGGRHGRLPVAGAVPRRGDDAGRRRLRPRASSSTRCSPRGCRGRARPWPSWRPGARARARCRRRRTTRPFRRRCRPRSCARSRATSRAATRRPRSSRRRCGRASSGREPPEPARHACRPGRWPPARGDRGDPGDGRLARHRDAGRARADLRAAAARAAGSPPRRPAPAKRSAGSRFMRTLGVLLLIAVLAAVIAGGRAARDRRRPGHRPRQDHLRRDRSADREHQGSHPRQPAVG